MSPLGAPSPWRAWRFIDGGAADGATNMATDLALLEESRRTGVCTLRVYGWARPTLSFGRHESTRGRFAAATLAAAGVDAVRRPTGGRALLHDREVTYAVTAPIEEGVTLGESFRGINALLADALARLGVQVRPAERGARATRPGLAACFAEPSEGELTVDGAKLVGSAQWRDEGALLQHGSILLDDDQARIASLLERGVPLGQAPSGRTPAAPVATLNALLGRQVERAEVAAALLDALADRCRRDGVTSPALVESHSGTSDAMRRHLAHFTDASWTWRR